MRHIAFRLNVTIGQKGITRLKSVDAFVQVGGADVALFVSSGNIVFNAPCLPNRYSLGIAKK
jgi:uncharacterized protein (DUF1697 family)